MNRQGPLGRLYGRVYRWWRGYGALTDIDERYIAAEKVMRQRPDAPSAQLFVDVMNFTEYSRWAARERKNGGTPVTPDNWHGNTWLYAVCVGMKPAADTDDFESGSWDGRIGCPMVGKFSLDAHMSQIARAMKAAWIENMIDRGAPHRALTPMVRCRMDGDIGFREWRRMEP